MCESAMSAGGLARLAEVATVLRTLPPAADDSERIDRIRALEELKSVAAAVQASETARFVAGERERQAAAGVPAQRVGRGVAAQVGLARRVSPYQAQRYAGWAQILTSELPATFTALREGRVSEWRAMIVARETGWLSSEHRAQVDEQLAARLDALGDRRVEAETKTLAYRLDPAGYIARTRGADTDRRVTIRPAPDTMCRLTGLLPVAQGVAAYAALRREADTRVADGDRRGRGQIMADTLIERLTGQANAADVPVEINLIMTDQALLGSTPTDAGETGETDPSRSADGSDEPAVLLDYGPIPAATARRLVYGPGGHVPMWLRRLYRHPHTGELAAMDSRRRLFTAGQRHYVRLRDHTCRTPWCDALIRHTDHITPYADGGPTSITNAQGLCEACNLAKQAPGWRAVPADTTGQIQITTPTGHTYRHTPPRPPGTLPLRPRPRSPVEQRLIDLLHAA